MTDFILDIAEKPARLRCENGLLVVESGDDPPKTVPLAEIAAVVLAHPQITCTRSAIAGLAGAGAVLIACDDRHMPAAMSLPLTGYHAPARRMRAQAGASLPTTKRLWQQVVRAKIAAQAEVLQEVRSDDFGLREMSRRVRSGDPDNLEGQASRVYWPALFNSTDFLRHAEIQDQNRYLNYGYAIVRAVTARAICAAGLHPGLGIHHHHRENAFCLADDLMEPFRPGVDRRVIELMEEVGPDAPMDKRVKTKLLSVAQDRFDFAGEQRTLFDAVARLTSSLASVFEGTAEELSLPEF